MGSQKTKADLIAENEALLSRVAKLEQKPTTHKRNNHLLRAFIDVLPDCGCSFDADGNVLEVLAGKESALHAEVRALKGQSIIHFLPRQDAEVLLAAITETIETGRTKSFEFQFSVLAGRRWFLGKTMAPKNGGSGRPTITCILEDITDRKVAASALMESQRDLEQQTAAKWDSENRLRNLIEDLPLGVVITQEAKPIFVNQALVELLGYGSQEEILEFESLAQIKPDYEAERMTRFREARLRGEEVPSRYEVDFLRKDGSVMTTENFVRVIQWEGAPANQITVIDNTERKQAEERLRENQRLLEAVFEAIPVGIQVKDREGRYLRVNHAMASIYGYRPDEITGMTFAELGIGTEEQRAVVAKDDRNVVDRGERIKDLAAPLTLPDGRTIWRNRTKVPLVDDTGAVVGVVGVMEDITDRKLLEDQFHEAQRLEAVGTLAGGIAHNFNNLLQIISGSISMFEAGMDAGHPDRQILSAIDRSIKRGSSLTRQLLGFARGGKFSVKQIDLNETIAGMAAMVLETHKNIQQIDNREDTLWKTKGDRNQIEQVLLNVLINACQAMPNGGQLAIQTENMRVDSSSGNFYELTPGQYVKLSITDTGTGMDQETLGRIFEPFFTTKEIGQGSGLGLASAYGIVKNHRGTITVDSEVGRGSTFEIYLPATEGEIAEFTEPPRKDERKGTGTILFVDDEKDLAAVGKRMLARLGYQVLVANSGNEALEVFEQTRREIDLVILDMVMPGMDGGEVFDKLRKLNPNVKVLLSSGFSLDGQATEIMERGCNGFVQKPFDLDGLSEKIREVLEQV